MNIFFLLCIFISQKVRIYQMRCFLRVTRHGRHGRHTRLEDMEGQILQLRKLLNCYRLFKRGLMSSSPPPHPRFGTGNWTWLNHPQNCTRFGEFGCELSLYSQKHINIICSALPVERCLVGEITHTCQSWGLTPLSFNNSYTSLENKM